MATRVLTHHCDVRWKLLWKTLCQPLLAAHLTPLGLRPRGGEAINGAAAGVDETEREEREGGRTRWGKKGKGREVREWLLMSENVNQQGGQGHSPSWGYSLFESVCCCLLSTLGVNHPLRSLWKLSWLMGSDFISQSCSQIKGVITRNLVFSCFGLVMSLSVHPYPYSGSRGLEPILAVLVLLFLFYSGSDAGDLISRPWSSKPTSLLQGQCVSLILEQRPRWMKSLYSAPPPLLADMLKVQAVNPA